MPHDSTIAWILIGSFVPTKQAAYILERDDILLIAAKNGSLALTDLDDLDLTVDSNVYILESRSAQSEDYSILHSPSNKQG